MSESDTSDAGTGNPQPTPILDPMVKAEMVDICNHGMACLEKRLDQWAMSSSHVDGLTEAKKATQQFVDAVSSITVSGLKSPAQVERGSPSFSWHSMNGLQSRVYHCDANLDTSGRLMKQLTEAKNATEQFENTISSLTFDFLPTPSQVKDEMLSIWEHSKPGLWERLDHCHMGAAYADSLKDKVTKVKDATQQVEHTVNSLIADDVVSTSRVQVEILSIFKHSMASVRDHLDQCHAAIADKYNKELTDSCKATQQLIQAETHLRRHLRLNNLVSFNHLVGSVWKATGPILRYHHKVEKVPPDYAAHLPWTLGGLVTENLVSDWSRCEVAVRSADPAKYSLDILR